MMSTADSDTTQMPWLTAVELESSLADTIQTIHSLSMDGGLIRYGWATKAPDGGTGFDTFAEPRFGSVLVFDEIYRDGFER